MENELVTSSAEKHKKKVMPVSHYEINAFMETMGYKTNITNSGSTIDTLARDSGQKNRKKVMPVNPDVINDFMESTMGYKINKIKSSSPMVTSVINSARKKRMRVNPADISGCIEMKECEMKKRKIEPPKQKTTIQILDRSTRKVVPTNPVASCASKKDSKAKKQLFSTRRTSVRKMRTISGKKNSRIPIAPDASVLKRTPNPTIVVGFESLNFSDSSNEFLELEKRCKENISPLSLITNKFEKASLKSARKSTNKDSAELLSDVESMLCEMERDCTEHKIRFRNMLHEIQTEQMKYETKVQQNMCNISAIINDMKLKNKPINNQIFKTPKLRNSLRKTAIKNQQKSNSKINGDLGMENSVRLYNSMKDTFSLSTPKSTRKSLHCSDSPCNPGTSLSRKLQKQCLLLLDTPARK